MISNLEKKIIFRYLKPKKKYGFLNIISIFSFIGISLGVAVLIIVMSVMNGFRTELTNKIIGFNAHVVIKPLGEKINLETFSQPSLEKKIKKFFITNKSEGVIINKNYTKGVLLRGYERNQFKNLEIVTNKHFKGNKNLNIKHISIGRELSYLLSANIGDKISIMSPFGIETIIGSLPKQETFIIDSIFESGILEFDQNVAFININNLESLFNLDSNDRFIELYLNDPLNVNKIINVINNFFSNENIYTWKDVNESLISALKVERNVMFIILTLIVIVAAFNIVSGLTILVKNKTKEIAILKSIGVRNNSIKKIFFMVGLTIGLSATITGVISGVLFSIYVDEIRILLSNIFNVSIFPEEIYFLNKMPSEINFVSIGIISLFSIIITSIVSIYPAIKASNLDPIKSLKYE